MDRYHGFCPVCGEQGEFERTDKRTRETFFCPFCRASLRYQAQASAIVQVYGKGMVRSLSELATKQWFNSMAIYEPGVAGPFRAIIKEFPSYVNSFYWSDVPNGEVRDGVACQDLHHTTYGDDTFDLIVTSDIFEHVRRPYVAFSEMRRILKPGGTHIFTIPVSFRMPEKSISRVDTSGDQDEHLLPDHYHGDGKGGRSLVYTEFGCDLFDSLKQISFPTFAALHYVSPDALPAVTLVSTKV